jgi:hypothetical protein
MPRDQFRQPMQPGGAVRQSYSCWFLAPIDSLKIPAKSVRDFVSVFMTFTLYDKFKFKTYTAGGWECYLA